MPHLQEATAIHVGFSGGLDSSVLLHALHTSLQSAERPLPHLHALYIDHALSPEAPAWQEHCEKFCAVLQIPFSSHRAGPEIKALRDAGHSIEAAARMARYRIFEAQLPAGGCLLLAHHQDDQMETMLYRLLRGSGLAGLSGMPGQRPLGRGSLLRPLLALPRSVLQSYAKAAGLQWIEDASNAETVHDRNYLRHRVMPLLKTRWPGFAAAWQRTAQFAAEAEQLQQALALQDLQIAGTEHSNCLHIGALKELSEVRQRNLLRHWLRILHERWHLALPDAATLHRIIREVLAAGQDAEPLVSWGREGSRIHLRRFQQRLYALRPQPELELSASLHWDTGKALQLPGALGTLSLRAVTAEADAGRGLCLDADRPLTVRFRQGGEQVKIAGRKTRPLKKILQDCQVPPWLRDKLPLVYEGDTLLAVADLFITEAALSRQSKTAAENIYTILWQREFIDCGY